MSDENDREFAHTWPRQDIGQRALTAQRRVQAVKLRVAGATFPQIAEQLGYADRAAAFKDVQRALEATLDELKGEADTLRALESERLNALTVALWTKAMAGDVKAVGEVRRLRESYRRLWGVDAPVEHHIFTIDAIDAEIMRLEREQARRAAEVQDAGSAGTPALPA